MGDNSDILPCVPKINKVRACKGHFTAAARVVMESRTHEEGDSVAKSSAEINGAVQHGHVGFLGKMTHDIIPKQGKRYKKCSSHARIDLIPFSTSTSDSRYIFQMYSRLRSDYITILLLPRMVRRVFAPGGRRIRPAAGHTSFRTSLPFCCLIFFRKQHALPMPRMPSIKFIVTIQDFQTMGLYLFLVTSSCWCTGIERRQCFACLVS